MERDIRLPKRKKNERLDLTELQMTFLDCYMLQIMEPGTLFRALISPSKTVRESNAMMKSLLRNSDAVSYMHDRREQLEDHYFGGGEKAETVQEKEMSLEDAQKRIVEKATKDLLDAMENDTAEIKNGNVIEKILIKAMEANDTDIDAPEPPRIYLPESCSSCRYRVAIEETDDTVDECYHCRYRQDDLDRGIEYDYKTQLNIKQE